MKKKALQNYKKLMEAFWHRKYEKYKGDERHVVGRLNAPLAEYISDTQNIKDCFNVVIDPGQSVVDFGCGIGRFQDFLKEKFEKYIGVDLVRKIPGPDMFLVVGDFMRTKLSVDAVFTCVVLQHITNDEYLETLIKKFATILKPGGCVYINEQVGDGSLLMRDGFPYIKRRTKKHYKDLFKRNGFILSREIPRREHKMLKFKKEKAEENQKKATHES